MYIYIYMYIHIDIYIYIIICSPRVGAKKTVLEVKQTTVFSASYFLKPIH